MSIENDKIMNLADGKVLYDDLRTRHNNSDTYVTPEEFGAVGDGSTNDTTALQNCINYARTNNRAVRGYKTYKTTSALTVSGSYMDIFIKNISYTGNANALIVRGSYHRLRFDGIYCNSGGGVIYKADSGSIMRNVFVANRIYCANGHCLELQQTESYGIYYNTFNIRDVNTDNGNCYHQHEHHCRD